MLEALVFGILHRVFFGIRERSGRGRTEDELTTSFSSVFALDMFPTRRRILPVKLEREFADILLVRREFACHSRLNELKATLLGRLRPWVETYPEIHLCE
jgi:hypothetical protein